MPRQSERIGRSGEYLVASLLSLYADTVVIVPHSAEADIIFDVDVVRLPKKDIMKKRQ
jgi:hypothetical protein